MDRFDELFDDLAAQVEAERQREREGEFGDLVAEKFYDATFVQRLAAAVGAPVDILSASGWISGTLSAVGDGCCLLGGDTMVMLPAIEMIRMRSAGHAACERRRSARSILSGWAMGRAFVRVETANAVVEGSLHAVAGDYVQLRVRGALHVVPLSKIAVVRVVSESEVG